MLQLVLALCFWLIPGGQLDAYAEAHADRMSQAGHIYHSDVSVPGDWDRLGEVVGVGSTIGSVWDALLESPEHRHIILDRRYERVGCGTSRREGRVYIACVFGR